MCCAASSVNSPSNPIHLIPSSSSVKLPSIDTLRAKSPQTLLPLCGAATHSASQGLLIENTLLSMGHVTAGELVDVYPEAQDSVHCATNLAADVASQLVVTYPVALLRVQTLASNTMRLNEHQRTLVAFTTLR